jgi:hypothetical protein
MDTRLATEATVSPDGKLVSFVAFIHGFGVSCCITRTALEEHFWVPGRADEARLAKAISDGHNRIAAAVERKMLRTNIEPIRLVESDFRH